MFERRLDSVGSEPDSASDDPLAAGDPAAPVLVASVEEAGI